ncbi:hypothetical protein WHZ78_11075 [Bradyrhizobium symbiodeficiens]|uniref:hypothetical protein n=1 Tax=Bradyrhizobium symbiodeficiens TaxID=1404367 RepID=UPI0030CB4D28
MQIDRRYADYALTGGFFLICQLSMIWALDYWPKIDLNTIKQLFPLPLETPLATTIVTGFAAALAVIAVFVVGLILDLLASLFRSNEMSIFARHLDLNSSWMTAFVEAHRAYCESDYQSFRRVFKRTPSFKEGLVAMAALYTFWRSESRRRVTAAMKNSIGFEWRIVPEYERLFSFFTTYVMGQSGSAQVTLIGDQYSLWRTARAIATAMYILAYEVVLLLLAGIVKALWKFVGLASFEGLGTIAVNYLYLLCLLGISVGITIPIVRGTYSRFCFTLFSLLYEACAKQTVSREDTRPTPAP